MKETEQLFNGYIAMFITQWKINCSHQILGTVLPLTTNTVTSVWRWHYPCDHHWLLCTLAVHLAERPVV